MRAAHTTTLEFLDAGADVVYQAGFFDGDFVGWADFLVREGDTWQVQDTKLARSEKVTALLQLAAYAQQLAKTGHKVADRVALILGSGAVSEFRTINLIPVFAQRMARLRTLVDERVAATGPLGWGEPGVKACLRCEACAPFVEQARDVLLVAGVTVTQRAKLAATGVHTVEELAAGAGPVGGIGTTTLDNLRRQARLQVAQDEANAGRGDDDPLVVKWQITGPAVLGTLPAPVTGDIFFDFEDFITVNVRSKPATIRSAGELVARWARPSDAPVSGSDPCPNRRAIACSSTTVRAGSPEAPDVSAAPSPSRPRPISTANGMASPAPTAAQPPLGR